MVCRPTFGYRKLVGKYISLMDPMGIMLLMNGRFFGPIGYLR